MRGVGLAPILLHEGLSHTFPHLFELGELRIFVIWAQPVSTIVLQLVLLDLAIENRNRPFCTSDGLDEDVSARPIR